MEGVPNHIAFIMDGNRRFAKERGLPPMEGHRAGYAKLKEVGDWCLEVGIKYLTVFGFSTENWKRAPDEVDFLMKLFHRAVTDELDEFHRKGIRLLIIGRTSSMSDELLRAFRTAEAVTADNAKATLTLAINYGGRAELVDACRALIASGVSETEVTEEMLAEKLMTAGIPDPDLVVRTSGERRLSGFLPWQSVYSELLFISTHWPGLSREEFDRMLADFAERERRYGK